MNGKLVLALALALALGSVMGSSHAAPEGPALARPAVATALAARSVLLGAARAGSRLVAVGERGIVLLSEDSGKTWRQVPVPVSVGLTAVRFVDAHHGWITGHAGVVLASIDGGQTWVKQLDGRKAAELLLEDASAAGDARAKTEAERLVADGADKPFLDAVFFDAQHGFVVGAYNLAFETRDGGRSWQPISRRLDNPRTLHLYSVRARGDELLVAGEQGMVLRSVDRGRSFQRLSVPYKGSFFTAEMPASGGLLVAGLRGNVWTTQDGGGTWTRLQLPLPMAVSFTASAIDTAGRPLLANQAGVVFTLVGETLEPARVKLPPLTGLLPLEGGQALALSLSGAIAVNLGTPK